MTDYKGVDAGLLQTRYRLTKQRAAILRALERVHPDLETLLRVDALGVESDVARKLALCIRQIGALVVRVSGRPVSSYPPQDR